MAEKLTVQQRQAVEDRGGRLLVSAAAGSGKTKVLVDRLLKYLNDPAAPANLDEFLIITYTKAAASELRGKIAAKLTEAIAAQPENRHLQRQMQRLFLTKISTKIQYERTIHIAIPVTIWMDWDEADGVGLGELVKLHICFQSRLPEKSQEILHIPPPLVLLIQELRSHII